MQLGRLPLYQLSYSRPVTALIVVEPLPEPHVQVIDAAIDRPEVRNSDIGREGTSGRIRRPRSAPARLAVKR